MNSEEKKSCDLCDDAGPLYLHARCHLTAPLKAAMEDGVLTLSCYIPECSRIVAKFKILQEVTNENH